MNELNPVNYINDTLTLRNNIEQGFLILGERLYNIKKDELWKGSYNSYQEFLSDMKLTEGTDSKLRSIYARFVLEYQMPLDKLAPCGWSHLYDIASKVEDKDAAIALIEKAETLKREDLAEEIRIHTHGEHECSGEEIRMLKCAVCKKLSRIG